MPSAMPTPSASIYGVSAVIAHAPPPSLTSEARDFRRHEETRLMAIFCDAHGRPDPNGIYELINGRPVLRDGQSMRFSMAFMDSAARPDSGGHRVFLTDDRTRTTFSDTERRFADSAEGQAAIAYERNKHALSEAHKGADARPWTDAMEADAIRHLTAQQGQTTTFAIDLGDAATLADAAWTKANDDLNAWRNGVR